MSDVHADLARLGDALERAAAEDLAAAPRPRPRRWKRRLLIAAAVLAVAIPASAIGASMLSDQQVANSLPAGSVILQGTDPTCTTVRSGVEYHCTLARPPAPEVQDFKGTVEETIDSTHHVNGGCRSLRSDGLVWECYIGQAAVDQAIISQGFLGQHAVAGLG